MSFRVLICFYVPLHLALLQESRVPSLLLQG